MVKLGIQIEENKVIDNMFADNTMAINGRVFIKENMLGKNSILMKIKNAVSKKSKMLNMTSSLANPNPSKKTVIKIDK